MCPSYMATREESHSTRGRANVLRLAMSGRLGEAGLGDEGVRQVLDLCLECRACKAECPGRRGRGAVQERVPRRLLAPPRHAHPCAHARTRPRCVAVGQPFRAAVECDRRKRTGALAERAAARHGSASRTAGLDGHDVREEFSAATGASDRRRCVTITAVGSVAFFNDTFTNYYSPEIGMAGVQVLEHAGFDVEARAALVLRPAADLAGPARRRRGARPRRAWSGCTRWPSEVLPIVFFEPSCLSAIREDVPSLLRGDAQRRALRVADRAGALRRVPGERMPGGTRAARSGPGAVADSPARALSSEGHGPPGAGQGAARPDTRRSGGRSRCRLLRHGRILRLRPRTLRGVARHRRAAAAAGRAEPSAEGAVLVASGTSCRHQVADFTGVRALHPAELISTLDSSVT